MRTHKRHTELITKPLIIGILCAMIFLSCSKNAIEEDKSSRQDLYIYIPDDNFEQLLIDSCKEYIKHDI